MVRYPVRLVLCVDGTWGDPDGTVGQRQGNISNIYRIFSVVKEGVVQDPDGSFRYQRKRYIRGIMDFDDWYANIRAGVLGIGLEGQIKEVYRLCCQFATQPNDEIFLFGYSRGAFTVQAVANMIHYMRMPKLTPDLAEFDTYYEALLQLYPTVRSLNPSLPGTIDNYMSQAIPQEQLPKIRFVGVFDTVKAYKDNNLYTATPIPAISHYRQALALNEYRTAFKPQISHPYSDPASMTTWIGQGNSFLQAWFIGSHGDLGGANKQDGLSLYALQWILGEAQKLNLVLGWEPIEYSNFAGELRYLENPQDLIFPYQDALDPVFQGPYSYLLQNGIKGRIWDLRRVHTKKKFMALQLHDKAWTGFPQARRKIFHDSSLIGYFPDGSYGTFIHPSAYMIYDLDIEIRQKSLKWHFLASFKAYRSNIITDEGERFWSRPIDDPKTTINRVRILVCGPNGVGKSTLVNNVFGIEVTPTSDVAYGVHDVNQEFVHEDSQVVIHDSTGFVEGSDKEIQMLDDFIRSRCRHPTLESRLHTIWYCLNPSTRERPLLTPADEKFFAILAKYDSQVPVVVILTKRDMMPNVKRQQTLATYTRHFQQLLSGVAGPVWVEEGNHALTDNLIQRTHAGVDNARVRALLISAQLCSVELKIEQALQTTFKWFNSWSVSNAGYLDMINPLHVVTGWHFMDTSRNLGQQLCRTVFETFGYTEIQADTAASVLWNRLRIASARTVDAGSPVAAFLSSLGLTALADAAELVTFAVFEDVVGMVLPLAWVFWLGVRGIRTFFKSAAFKRVLLTALADVILIADFMFWIDPKTLTGAGLEKGCDFYIQIAPRVREDIEKMAKSFKENDLFDFQVLGAPLSKVIKEYRVRREDISESAFAQRTHPQPVNSVNARLST